MFVVVAEIGCHRLVVWANDNLYLGNERCVDIRFAPLPFLGVDYSKRLNDRIADMAGASTFILIRKRTLDLMLPTGLTIVASTS